VDVVVKKKCLLLWGVKHQCSRLQPLALILATGYHKALGNYIWYNYNVTHKIRQADEKEHSTRANI
jgi:hypothetical protein